MYNVYGDMTHHSVNSAYNSYYTKRKFSYHSVETWLTPEKQKQIDSKEKAETSEQRDERLKRRREADKQLSEAETP